jgi:hypothetical protein
VALIYIEGVDHTGKSTLAGELKRLLKERDPHHVVRVLHFGAPEADALHEYIGPILDYSHEAEHLVLDRFHVGEAVWPRYFGRESRMTEVERALIEQFLTSIGAVGVLAQRPEISVRASFEASAARGEPEPLAVEDIGPAISDFEREFHEVVLTPRLYYNHGVDIKTKRLQAQNIVEAAVTCAELAPVDTEHSQDLRRVLASAVRDG